jgi:hypothetical protein
MHVSVGQGSQEAKLRNKDDMDEGRCVGDGGIKEDDANEKEIKEYQEKRETKETKKVED